MLHGKHVLAHTHPQHELVTVIEGTWYLGEGTKFRKNHTIVRVATTAPSSSEGAMKALPDPRVRETRWRIWNWKNRSIPLPLLCEKSDS